MSLLHDVLADSVEKKKSGIVQGNHNSWVEPDESEDELVSVVSLPSTPVVGSRPSSRPQSPAPGGATRQSQSSRLPVGSKRSTDPLRAFPTEVSQRIFSQLIVQELSRCARVSRKWNKSQTLNYIWFQQYRKENFHDDSLPPGKWTKRESKQDWRRIYSQIVLNRSAKLGPINPTSRRGSGYSTPSGYVTPKEWREEKWQAESEAVNRPSKQELRDVYKELGGRKAKTKIKLGSIGGARNKGGLGDDEV